MKKIFLPFIAAFLPLISNAQLVASNDTSICKGTVARISAADVDGIVVTQPNWIPAVDDTYSDVIDLGFSFEFYGETYTQCLISTNNYITFDLSQANLFSDWEINFPAPNASLPTNAIMCPFVDTNPEDDGIAEYETVGEAPNRVFVLRYFGVPMFDCPSESFCSSVLLYEGTNIIETHIDEKPICFWNSASAIHGLQDPTGTIADIVPGRNFPVSWSTTQEGVRFTPNGPNAYTIEPTPFKEIISNTTIEWYQGGTFIGVGDTMDVTPTVTTTYEARFTFCTGAIWNDFVTVSIIPDLSFSVQEIPTACDSASGIGTVTPSGGSGFYTYSWAPGGYTDSMVSDLSMGLYTVSVTDTVTGCITDTMVNILEDNPLDIVIDSVKNAVCFGSATGFAAVTGVNGTPDYSWQWNDPLMQTDSFATGLVAGAYQVVVTDSNRCMDSIIVNVGEANDIALNPANVSDPDCNGDSNGIAGVSISGGTPGYSYQWDDASNQTTNPATGLPAGTYNLIVTDSEGCTNNTSIVLNDPATLTASVISQTDVSCNGGTDGTGEVAGSGGTTPYSYAWTGLGINTPDANNLSAGTYDIMITDLNGCDTSAQVVVSEPTELILNTSATTQTTCGSSEGSATVNPIGGVSPFIYQWDNGTGSQTTSTANSLGTGTYEVIVTDGNGCNDTTTVTITDTLDISASFTSTPMEGVIPLDVNFLNTTTGNPVTYDWDYGNGETQTTNGLSTNTTYIDSGVYVVTLTAYNAGGCSSVYSLNILVKKESFLILPNVFSPNGDGINDIWHVTHEAIIEYECTIFNRWGKKTYTSTDVSGGWDGDNNNTGTYYYVIKALGADNKTFELSGEILLLR